MHTVTVLKYHTPYPHRTKDKRLFIYFCVKKDSGIANNVDPDQTAPS